MPINSTHPQYDLHVDQWQKIADVLEGEERVKQQGELYLPKLTNQHPDEYDAYRQRAMFYGATGRTVTAIEGAVFRKAPFVVFPVEDFLNNVGKNKQPFSTFAKSTFRRAFSFGRYGVLLDTGENTAVNESPYMVGYSTLAILNWTFAVINNRKQLMEVVLKEEIERKSNDDPFKWETIEQYRHLFLSRTVEETNLETGDLDSLDNDGSFVYQVHIWEKVEHDSSSKKDDEFVFVKAIVPNIGGKRLSYIPFVIFGTEDLGGSVDKSPILDLVNVNLSHYRNSADMEHGLHYTALPTPWAAGFDTKRGDTLYLGSTRAWISQSPEARAGFLEFTGTGLGAIEKNMQTKEANMAILGARLLEQPKRAVEAADTHLMRKSGEDSTTAAIANLTALGFQILLKWAAEWMGKPSDKVECVFNTDFLSIQIDPAYLTSLLGALTQGKISYDTFYYNLIRGEVIPEGRTAEEELELIDEDGMRIPATKEDLLGDEDNEDTADDI